jgi:hypothetical protein
MQYFIALTFDEQDLAYQKIDNFRQMFDHKHGRSPHVLMSLLPPFSFLKKKLSHLDYNKMVECLKDDLDNYLSGIDGDFKVRFNGFDFASGKKGVVYLKPELPNEMFFFQEAASEYLCDHGATFLKQERTMKPKDSGDSFLPIGRGGDQQLLRRAVEKARVEFTLPFHLRLREVILFEKLPGQWIKRAVLHRFEEKAYDPYEVVSEESNGPDMTKLYKQYRI